MKTNLNGFLFGHYDSRGGATFVVAQSKEEAFKKYASAFWMDEEEKKTEGLEVAKEDFLGAATLESELEIEDGTDLEYNEQGPDQEGDGIHLPLWVKFEAADPFDAGLQGAPGTYHLVYGGECPEGHAESELGEDAFGVILMKEGVEQ